MTTPTALAQPLHVLGLHPQHSDPELVARFTGYAPEEEVALLAAIGGQSDRDGLYWAFTATQAQQADKWVWGAFSELKQRQVRCFGRDWLGRLFALDPNRGVVFMIDANTGIFSVSGTPLNGFYTEDLIDYRDEVLEPDLHAAWLEQGGTLVDVDTCVTYKVPAFLDGSQEPDALDRINLDVHWTLTGQLIAHVLGEPYDWFDAKVVSP